MDNWLLDLRLAWRSLARSPSFTGARIESASPEVKKVSHETPWASVTQVLSEAW